MSQNVVSVIIKFEIGYVAGTRLATWPLVEFVDNCGVHHTILDSGVLYAIFGSPPSVCLGSTKLITVCGSGPIAYRKSTCVFMNMNLCGAETQEMSRLSAGYFLDLVEFHRDKIEKVLDRATVQVKKYIEKHGVSNTIRASSTSSINDSTADISVTNVPNVRFLRF